MELVATHVHEDELSLYLNGHLAAGRIAGLESHLASCAECKQKLDATLHFITKLAGLRRPPRDPASPERRHEPRFPSDEPIFMRVLRPLSPAKLAGRMANVSTRGMGLILNQALERGALVQVRTGTTVLLGEVRHCSKTGNEFTLGIQLEDVMTP